MSKNSEPASHIFVPLSLPLPQGERPLEQLAKRLSTPQLPQSGDPADRLTPTMDLTFAHRPGAPPPSADAPYDFSRFLAAREPSEDPGPTPAPARRTHRRVWSAGSAVAGAAAREEDRPAGTAPERGAIWCMDCSDGLLAVGCSDGAVELWDAATGALKVGQRRDAGSGDGIGHRVWGGGGWYKW